MSLKHKKTLSPKVFLNTFGLFLLIATFKQMTNV